MPPKSSKSREIVRKFKLNSSSRSFKVIDLGVNRKHKCNFLLVINSNLDVSLTVFEILTFKARKWLVFSRLPCLTPSLREPLRMSFAKTRGMQLPYGENFIILASINFLLIHRVTDRQTDGQAITYSPLSICICYMLSRAKKTMG